jgi:hypothetical protein
MEKTRDMGKHVTFVAALQIGFGVLGLISAVIVYFVFAFIMQNVNDVEIATVLFNALQLFIPLLISVGSVLGIIGGVGLLRYKPWSRILVLVLSALDCLSVPIGTARGVYSIWVLLQDDTLELFAAKE